MTPWSAAPYAAALLLLPVTLIHGCFAVFSCLRSSEELVQKKLDCRPVWSLVGTERYGPERYI